MSKISHDEVRRLSALALVALDAAEVAAFAKDLEQILEYVERLQAVDTRHVEPTSQVTGLVDVWREDKAKPQPKRAELLKNAPDQEDNYIKVRRVL